MKHKKQTFLFLIQVKQEKKGKNLQKNCYLPISHKFFLIKNEIKTPKLQLPISSTITLPSSTNDVIGFMICKGDVTLVYISTAGNLCPTSNFDQWMPSIFGVILFSRLSWNRQNSSGRIKNSRRYTKSHNENWQHLKQPKF